MDFTDKELYCVALAISTHLSSRETHWTKNSAANFKSMLEKVIAEGMERKDPKSILHPIVEFEDDYKKNGEKKMKTLKTENGIKIEVRSIEEFDDNAKILEFGSDHYSSGDYVEGFQVDMVVEATLADGTSKSFTVSCQSADISTDKLRAHGRTEMRFAIIYGAYWDESGALENFVRSIEYWDEIAEFLIVLAEDLCQKWYSANKDEATND